MPTGTWWFIGAAWGGLLLAALLLRSGGTRSAEGGTVDVPPPQALALLRGGRRAAVTVALVALHQRGAVAAGRKHTIRANGGPGRTRDPVQLGVHRALRRALALGTLAQRPEARRAVDALRGELCGAGLLRPPERLWTARALLGCVPLTALVGPYAAGASGTGLAVALAAGAPPAVAALALLRLPDTTGAARRLLAGLRERYPLPAHRREVTDGWLVQLYVALYGDPALALFLPRFSREGGLLDRPPEDDGNRPPADGGPVAGGASC
ncbi:TIGR04222 domain-containing membrane protein [Streptomyces sp. TLI_105]|uniref:TIGR04222 domain-containing membrane protein n=1 Tax=Streptomyces sp. TLI_105 TaxID=1881019 RepID=UPI00089CCC56|nr:TIGR04222 domain-containing membrane protein [Streptomyces sp. TLI_105]SEC13709.1 TIGR04222 domain-containing protein [Streptomyces sp. TLI_105]